MHATLPDLFASFPLLAPLLAPPLGLFQELASEPCSRIAPRKKARGSRPGTICMLLLSALIGALRITLVVLRAVGTVGSGRGSAVSFGLLACKVAVGGGWSTEAQVALGWSTEAHSAHVLSNQGSRHPLGRLSL